MNYTSVTPEAKKEFWQMIEKAEKIIITSHISPDDDSISSTLGLLGSIEQLYPGKEVRIVYTGLGDKRFSFLRNFEKIEWTTDILDVLGETDLLIELDAGQYYRATKKSENWPTDIATICVDHHASSPDLFSLSIIDTTAPDCAELIYSLCDHVTLDQSLAETFLLGILGDTGNFAYIKPHQTKTLLIAAKLIEEGKINIQEFQSKYRGISEKVFEVMKELIKNIKNTEVEGYKPFSYSFVTKEFIEDNHVSNEDLTAGKSIFISQYIRTIENHPWGFTVIPRPDGVCNISARSLPSGENVRLILEGLGIGGGHDLASGGTFKDESDPEKVVEQVMEFLKKAKVGS